MTDPARRFPPELLVCAQGAGLGVKVALFDVDGVLTVAMADPQNVAAWRQHAQGIDDIGALMRPSGIEHGFDDRSLEPLLGALHGLGDDLPAHGDSAPQGRGHDR